MLSKNGSLQIFRLLGVSVYVHWTWVLAGIWRIQLNMDAKGPVSGDTHGIPYHTAWLLGLFGIVLVHEFGHSLACKSVGGKADTIVLQPLGGVAFVQPPDRPGPTLWSIAAGPLVNATQYGTNLVVADFLSDMALINLGLLVFNMLPFFPLDGGQILRSILWFIFGKGVSLIIAGIVGIAGTAGLALLALMFVSGSGGILIALLILFMGLQCIVAIRVGMLFLKVEHAPRRFEARCPSCGQNPPIGALWRCACGAQFDTFEAGARCPKCSRTFDATACPLCNQAAPLAEWYPLTPGVNFARSPADPAT